MQRKILILRSETKVTKTVLEAAAKLRAVARDGVGGTMSTSRLRREAVTILHSRETGL